MSRMSSTLTSLLVAALVVVPSHAAHSFQVHRCLQYDSKQSELGCRKTYLSSTVVPFNAEAALLALNATKQSQVKQTIMVKLDELTIEQIPALLKRSSTGVLVLLPQKQNGAARRATAAVMRELELLLISEAHPIPIYFAQHDDKLSEVYDTLKKRENVPMSYMSDDYAVVVSDKQGELITGAKVTNIQGSLQGEGQEPMTIIITAHYDTMGAVPGLTSGTDINGSGVIALLELARIFSKLYSSSDSKGQYNIVFLLSGGGRLNYIGSGNWLKTAPQDTIGSIEFALCLEGVGQEKLNLHTSRKIGKDKTVGKLYEVMSEVAAEMSVPFEISTKKINIKGSEMAWEHEGFAYKKVVAATLSDQSVARQQISRSFALDEGVSQATLERNVAFIAESLARYIYGSQAGNGTLLARTSNAKLRSTTLEYLGKAKRNSFVANPELVSTLKSLLGLYTSDVTEKAFPLKSDTLKVYDKMTVEMRLHLTKSFIFDIALLLPVLAYLLSIAIYFRGVSVVGTIRASIVSRARDQWLGQSSKSGK